MNFSVTNRGGKLLNYKGYEYVIDKSGSGVTYWRCRIRECTGRGMTYFGDENKFTHSQMHSHSRNDVSRKVNKIINDAKTSAYETLNGINGLYDNLFGKIVEPEVIVGLPRRSTILQRMRRSRCKKWPILPKTVDEIDTSKIEIRLINKQKFLLFDIVHESNTQSKERLICFGTEQTLQLLSETEVIHLDGTFECVPKQFKQMLTMHGYYKKRCFPLIHVLCIHKTYDTYSAIMYHLKKVMWERNLVFSAKIIHCDFELALVKAISFNFQEIKIYGCYFHYCQCIYRQVNALGLTTLYKTDREIYRWIR
jgi:hypothetical protein